MVLCPVISAKLEEVDILDDTERGKEVLDPLDTKMSYNKLISDITNKLFSDKLELESKKDFKLIIIELVV